MNTHTLHTHTPRRTHAQVHSPHVCAHTSTHPPRNTNQTHSHVTSHGNASNARISHRPRTAPNHVRSDHEDQTQTRTPITNTLPTRAPYIRGRACTHTQYSPPALRIKYIHAPFTRALQHYVLQHSTTRRQPSAAISIAWLHGLAHVGQHVPHSRAHTLAHAHRASAHAHAHACCAARLAAIFCQLRFLVACTSTATRKATVITAPCHATQRRAC